MGMATRKPSCRSRSFAMLYNAFLRLFKLHRQRPSRSDMLTDQPTEIIEEILSWVDHRQDLLSLALTTRLLRDLIIPHHIQFRRVRCHPHYNSIWSAIISRPTWAANIRTLEIVDAHKDPIQIIPPCLMREIDSDDPYGDVLDQKSAVLLARAVTTMANLAHFSWFGYAPGGPPVQLIFDALVKSNCHLLEFGYGHRVTPIFHPHLTLHVCFSFLTVDR